MINRLIEKTKNKTPEEIALEKGIDFPIEDSLEYNSRSKKWREKLNEQKRMLEKEKKMEEMEKGEIKPDVVEKEVIKEFTSLSNPDVIDNSKQCE